MELNEKEKTVQKYHCACKVGMTPCAHMCGSNIDLRFEKSLENIRYCIIHHPDMNFNGARKRTQKIHADLTADQ